MLSNSEIDAVNFGNLRGLKIDFSNIVSFTHWSSLMVLLTLIGSLREILLNFVLMGRFVEMSAAYSALFESYQVLCQFLNIYIWLLIFIFLNLFGFRFPIFIFFIQTFLHKLHIQHIRLFLRLRVGWSWGQFCGRGMGLG